MKFAFLRSEFSGKDIVLIETRVDGLVMLLVVGPPSEFALDSGHGIRFLVVDIVQHVYELDAQHVPKPEIIQQRQMRERPQWRATEASVKRTNVLPVVMPVRPGRYRKTFGSDVRAIEYVLQSQLRGSMIERREDRVIRGYLRIRGGCL